MVTFTTTTTCTVNVVIDLIPNIGTNIDVSMYVCISKYRLSNTELFGSSIVFVRVVTND